jgi:hypothetical protein
LGIVFPESLREEMENAMSVVVPESRPIPRIPSSEVKYSNHKALTLGRAHLLIRGDRAVAPPVPRIRAW